MKVQDKPGCEGCPLRNKLPNNQFVDIKAGKGLRLMIGDAPSEEDAAKNEPFSDGAGRWLDGMARKAGIDKADVTFVNCIQCAPPEGHFPTTPDARRFISSEDAYKAVVQCRQNYVEPLLKARPWTRIDLLGSEALQFVAKKDGGVDKWRGSPLAVPVLGEQLVAISTLHPKDIAANQKFLPVVINDLCKTLVPPPEHYNLFPSITQVREFKATKFAFDLETSYDKERRISMVGLCAKPTEVMVVPFHGAYIEELKRIFKDATELIHQNGLMFDVPVLKKWGIEVNPKAIQWDVMLLHHLRFPNLPHDLEFIGSQFNSKPIWKHLKETLELYCARDTDITMGAFLDLKPILENHKLIDLYLDVQVPLAKICHQMETLGFKVDPARIEEVRANLRLKMAEEEAHLPDHLRSRTNLVNKRHPAPAGTVSAKTGKPVKYVYLPEEEIERPWASADVIAEYLYNELKLPIQVDSKTEKVTTGKVALEKLFRRTKNRSIEALRRLRKHASIMNLFAKEEMIEAGIQHPHFNVHGTASGRLSSSDPNLQNIPEHARFLYVPHNPGWKIIDVDFSQIENRLTAHFAGDKARLQRFIDDPKFSEHKYLASIFLGVPYAEVEKSSDPDSAYIKAKKIVHGTNYGEGAKKIALMNDLDFLETKKLQNQWKQAIAETTRWQERCAAEADKMGYLVTPFGRKRWFYTSSRYTESLSFMPQSTAADMIFRVMLALMHERIGLTRSDVECVVKHIEPLPQPARLLLQVHDSLMFECPTEKLAEVIGVIKRVMEQPWPELDGFWCPIGINVGPSWGEATEWKG